MTLKCSNEITIPVTITDNWTHSLASRHSRLTPAKNEGIDIDSVGPIAEVWSISKRYLFIHSLVSVNRNIVGYNKDVLVITVFVVFVSYFDIYYGTWWTAEGSVLAAAVSGFFVCVWIISGTAEQICAKFIQKTCLVPRSDEGDGQGHHGQKPAFFSPFGGLRVVYV